MSTFEAVGRLEVGRPASSGVRLLRRIARRPVAVAAIVIIVIIYGAGILAPLVAPYSFTEADLLNRNAGIGGDHLLGTDNLGRDLLSRAIWSARTTVIISVLSLLAGGLAMGVTLGLLAGYLRGTVDAFIMRMAEIFYSVPTLLLMLIINASLRTRVEDWGEWLDDKTRQGWIEDYASYFLVLVVLSFFGWPGIARIVRSQVLALRESAYVVAARASGASTPRIVFRHLLPNVSNLLIVALTLSLGGFALAEVGLSFLGIGISGHPTFGLMISEAASGPGSITYVRAHPLVILVPGFFISMLVLAFNLLGDQLTDVLSPRRR
ncbi:MAG TPA: ABC transporter permease [Dehalococcoidia bacterium]|nr:ABC transporter permease [Dehalococcoidia bacterium]